MPSAAALRKTAPTFVWSTMSSRTTSLRARRARVHGRQGPALSDASAPRWTWKPVAASATLVADEVAGGLRGRVQLVGQSR